MSNAENETSAASDQVSFSSARDDIGAEIFDHADFLQRMDNDEEIYQLVLETFLQDVPERLLAYKDALQLADFQKIIEISHSIKGTAANISASSLSSYAAVIEKAAKANDMDTVLRISPDLEAGFNKLENLLQKILN